MELWISTSYPFAGCFGCRISVDFVYNYPVASIKILAQLKKTVQEVNSTEK